MRKCEDSKTRRRRKRQKDRCAGGQPEGQGKKGGGAGAFGCRDDIMLNDRDYVRFTSTEINSVREMR